MNIYDLSFPKNPGFSDFTKIGERGIPRFPNYQNPKIRNTHCLRSQPKGHEDIALVGKTKHLVKLPGISMIKTTLFFFVLLTGFHTRHGDR